jgi:acyl carrier protein
MTGEQTATAVGIRQVLGAHARLLQDAATIDAAQDLFEAGMTSHASISVMLELEEYFGIEFPESMLRKSTFGSVNSIASAIATLGEGGLAR